MVRWRWEKKRIRFHFLMEIRRIFWHMTGKKAERRPLQSLTPATRTNPASMEVAWCDKWNLMFWIDLYSVFILFPVATIGLYLFFFYFHTKRNKLHMFWPKVTELLNPILWLLVRKKPQSNSKGHWCIVMWCKRARESMQSFYVSSQWFSQKQQGANERMKKSWLTESFALVRKC